MHTDEPCFTSSLRELSLSWIAFRNTEDLHELSSYISSNSSLRVLDLNNLGEPEREDLWRTFFDAIRNAKYLESITIYEFTNDAVMESFCN
jgi:hypothetical protein